MTLESCCFNCESASEMDHLNDEGGHIFSWGCAHIGPGSVVIGYSSSMMLNSISGV